MLNDTDILNRTLWARVAASRDHQPRTDRSQDERCLGGGPDYCHNLNDIVEAMNVLGLDFAYYPIFRSVHVMQRQWQGTTRRVQVREADDTTPAAIATALVQAALAVLAGGNPSGGSEDFPVKHDGLEPGRGRAEPWRKSLRLMGTSSSWGCRPE